MLREYPVEVQDQFSVTFLEGMCNRMAVSYHKYGDLRTAYPHKVNALESLQLRLKKYIETGNTEFLIDAANFAMIEFMCPSLLDAHFTPTDSDQSPGRIEKISGEAVSFANRDLLGGSGAA